MLEIFNDEEIKNDQRLMKLKKDYVNALDDFATTFWEKVQAKQVGPKPM